MAVCTTTALRKYLTQRSNLGQPLREKASSTTGGPAKGETLINSGRYRRPLFKSSHGADAEQPRWPSQITRSPSRPRPESSGREQGSGKGSPALPSLPHSSPLPSLTYRRSHREPRRRRSAQPVIVGGKCKGKMTDVRSNDDAGHDGASTIPANAAVTIP